MNELKEGQGLEGLTEGQTAVIRTLFELAQGRVEYLYAPEHAEQEKTAIEDWICEQFPHNYTEIVRATYKESPHAKQP